MVFVFWKERESSKLREVQVTLSVSLLLPRISEWAVLRPGALCVEQTSGYILVSTHRLGYLTADFLFPTCLPAGGTVMEPVSYSSSEVSRTCTTGAGASLPISQAL